VTLTVDRATERVAGTSTAPTGSSLWRSVRWPLAVLAVFVVAATLIGSLQRSGGGDLDPRSYTPGGTHAVAVLAEQQGVPVRAVLDVDELRAAVRPGTRVVVADARAVTPAEASVIQRVVANQSLSLLVVGTVEPESWDRRVAVSGSTDTKKREPDCDLAAARRAGSARTGALAYAGPGTACYADTLLSVPRDRTTFLGSADVLTNDRLDQDGNASLSLSLATQQDGKAATQVLWFVPRPGRTLPAGDPGTDETIGELLPDGLVFGVLQVALAFVVLALWRARRLGRVVPERLPVVVRAAESVEGRARLYRAAGARGQAAEALRAGARDRLARGLGLAPRSTSRPALVGTLAQRTGQDPPAVDELLYGRAPVDDAGLVELADRLDQLESSTRQTARGTRPEGTP
jgi:hypothetical protein